jgi:hypothetical protein
MMFSGSFLPHQPHLGAQLKRLITVQGPIDLRGQARPSYLHNKKLALTISTGGPVLSCGRPDAAGGWSIHVALNGDVTCTGANGPVVVGAGSLGSIKLKYSRQSGSKDEVDIPLRLEPNKVTLLLPGPTAAILRRVTLPLTITVSSPTNG